jgi:hypothetical protein
VTTKQEAFAKVRALMTKKDELIGRLERSLAIAEIWPEAFDHGAANGYIMGAPATGFKFIVKAGDGEEREWELNEVPDCLTKDFQEMRKRAMRR